MGPRAFVACTGGPANSRNSRRLYDYMLLMLRSLPWTFRATAIRCARGLTLEPVLECIAKAIRQAPSVDITLVGNCGGAQLGLETLRVYGLNVPRVLLIDPFAYCPWYFRLFTWGTFGRKEYYTTFANPLGRFITNNALRKRRRPETNLTSAFVKVDHAVAHRYLCLMLTLADSRRFKSLQVDVDIVHGDRTSRRFGGRSNICAEVFPGRSQ